MCENYVKEIIKSHLGDYIQIPYNFCPTKFYSITFEGWKSSTITYEDPTFNEMSSLGWETAKNIITKYLDTHAFTEPQFFWKPDGSFGIKIGLMELELYDKLMKKHENIP